MFSPYTEVKEQYPSARQALRDLIDRAQERDISAYIHVNNRLEGNAIPTIEGIVSRTDLMMLASFIRALGVHQIAFRMARRGTEWALPRSRHRGKSFPGDPGRVKITSEPPSSPRQEPQVGWRFPVDACRPPPSCCGRWTDGDPHARLFAGAAWNGAAG